jgi:hypothetical protein
MRFSYIFLFFIVPIVFLTIGCGPNEEILKSNSNQAAAEPTAVANSQPAYDTVESEVQNMRTADFNFIFVLRRKDGGVMQPDDKAFVRTNAPNANRRSLVENGKAIVIGANAVTLGDVTKKLSERFEVQDFSKPAAENANSNTPSNANIVR